MHIRARCFALFTMLLLTSAATQAQVRIVALGDSNIAGKGVSTSQAYPAQLEAALRARGLDVTVSNAGINGNTTADVLSRLDRAVPDGTDFVIYSVGINDLFAGVSAEKMKQNFAEIGQRLKSRGIPWLAFGPNQVLGPFQGDIEGRADLHVEAPGQQRNLYHLNEAGYTIIVKRTMPKIFPMVKKIADAKKKQRG